MTSPHITQLRQYLMDTLADLRNKENPMEPDQARAVVQVAGALIDIAKVEVDYLKVTGQDHCSFLELSTDAHVTHLTTQTAALPNGISSITRHRIA